MALKDLIVPTLCILGIVHCIKGCNSEKGCPVRVHIPRQPDPIHQIPVRQVPVQQPDYYQEVYQEQPVQIRVIHQRVIKKTRTVRTITTPTYE